MNKFLTGLCVGIVIGGLICITEMVHGQQQAIYTVICDSVTNEQANVNFDQLHWLLPTAKIDFMLKSYPPPVRGLTVSTENPNYLAYNGETTLLITDSPYRFTIMGYDTSFIKQATRYGVNHIFLTLEINNETPFWWIEGQGNRPTMEYWDKLRLICTTAYKYDVAVGICIFSFSIKDNKRLVSSFRSECTQCKRNPITGGNTANSPGPLNSAAEFWLWNSPDARIHKGINAQKGIIKQVALATWDLPNVYYSWMWEIKCVWTTQTAMWIMDAREYMQGIGKTIDPNIKHLFALERTTTVAEARTWGIDLIHDEDGNAVKTPGLPFVFWSIDGAFRGKIGWNSEVDQNGFCQKPPCEPDQELNYMVNQVKAGVAGIAPVWEANDVEKRNLDNISFRSFGVMNWTNPTELQNIQVIERE